MNLSQWEIGTVTSVSWVKRVENSIQSQSSRCRTSELSHNLSDLWRCYGAVGQEGVNLLLFTVDLLNVCSTVASVSLMENSAGWPNNGPELSFRPYYAIVNYISNHSIAINLWKSTERIRKKEENKSLSSERLVPNLLSALVISSGY